MRVMRGQRDARVKDMEASKVDEKELEHKRTEIDRLKKGEVIDVVCTNPLYLSFMAVIRFLQLDKFNKCSNWQSATRLPTNRRRSRRASRRSTTRWLQSMIESSR